jgi:hypothetical protein
MSDSEGESDRIVNCPQCKEEVKHEAHKCPHCDYHAGEKDGKIGVIIALAGAVLSLTLIGSILGIPLVIYGLYKALKSNRKTMGTKVSA